jgi:hypothetical protein
VFFVSEPPPLTAAGIRAGSSSHLLGVRFVSIPIILSTKLFVKKKIT